MPRNVAGRYQAGMWTFLFSVTESWHQSSQCCLLQPTSTCTQHEVSVHSLLDVIMTGKEARPVNGKEKGTVFLLTFVPVRAPSPQSCNGALSGSQQRVMDMGYLDLECRFWGSWVLAPGGFISYPQQPQQEMGMQGWSELPGELWVPVLSPETLCPVLTPVIFPFLTWKNLVLQWFVPRRPGS